MSTAKVMSVTPCCKVEASGDKAALPARHNSPIIIGSGASCAQWWHVVVLVATLAFTAPAEAASIAGIDIDRHTAYQQASHATVAAVAAIVAAAAVAAAAMLGCLSSSRSSRSSSACTCEHCEFHAEKEFSGPADAADASSAANSGTPTVPVKTIKLLISKMDAMYSHLGQNMMKLRDNQTNLASQQKALEVAKEQGHDASMPEKRIKEEQAKCDAQAAKVEGIATDLELLRSESIKQVMPQAKRGQETYDAAAATAFKQDRQEVDALASLLAGIECVPTAPVANAATAGENKVKAGRQPADGKTLPELQRTGVAEAQLLWEKVVVPVAKEAGVSFAGGYCEFEKEAGRAYQKALRYDGDPANVSDYGRGTATFESMHDIHSFVEPFLKELEAQGYEVATIKNTLDPTKEVLGAIGYRNVLFNVRAPGSGHVLEMQVNLATIEAIKHGILGHINYELLRKCGVGDRTEYTGVFSEDLVAAVESGRALKLVLDQTEWSEPDAIRLGVALASPSSRVHEITAEYMKGKDKVAAVVAIAKAAFAAGTVKVVG